MENPEHTLEDFSKWKVNALKEYLSKRGLKVEGNKATLVARAFAAWEMQIPMASDHRQYSCCYKFNMFPFLGYFQNWTLSNSA